MKVDCVLTATDNKSLYYNFIPMFVKAWNKLYPMVDVKIIFISHVIPDEMLEYEKNIIQFKPIDGISTAFISQVIRILYPSIMNYDEGVMVSDMDMIPMNSTFFTNHVIDIEPDKFVCLRNVIEQHGEYPICYNVASPKTWSEFFNVNSLEDVTNKICELWRKIKYDGRPGFSGWNTDQTFLYSTVQSNLTRFVSFKDHQTGFKRLDRMSMPNIQEIENLITYGEYSDYHCLRPYDTYKTINDRILSILPDNSVL